MTKPTSRVQPLGKSPTAEAARLNKLLKGWEGPLFYSRAEYDGFEITLSGVSYDDEDWKLVIAGKPAGPIILPMRKYAVTGLVYSRSESLYKVTLKPCLGSGVLLRGFTRSILIKPAFIN